MNLTLPFCAKELPTGEKLFRRKKGLTFTLAATGETVVQIAVPYAKAKINEAEIFWAPEGVSAVMKVKDTATGTYSTIPNYVLNEYGHDVNIAKDYYRDISPYDADVRVGMVLEFTFTNRSGVEKLMGLNTVFHEVV